MIERLNIGINDFEVLNQTINGQIGMIICFCHVPLL